MRVESWDSPTFRVQRNGGNQRSPKGQYEIAGEPSAWWCPSSGRKRIGYIPLNVVGR